MASKSYCTPGVLTYLWQNVELAALSADTVAGDLEFEVLHWILRDIVNRSRLLHPCLHSAELEPRGLFQLTNLKAQQIWVVCINGSQACMPMF